MSDRNLFTKLYDQLLNKPWIAYPAIAAVILLAVLTFAETLSGWGTSFHTRIFGASEDDIMILDISLHPNTKIEALLPSDPRSMKKSNIEYETDRDIIDPFIQLELMTYLGRSNSTKTRTQFAGEWHDAHPDYTHRKLETLDDVQTGSDVYRFQDYAERTSPLEKGLTIEFNISFRNDSDKKKLLNGMRVVNVLPKLERIEANLSEQSIDRGNPLITRANSAFFVNDWGNIYSQNYESIRSLHENKEVLRAVDTRNTWFANYQLVGAEGLLVQYAIEPGEIFSWDVQLVFNDYPFTHLVELSPRIDGEYQKLTPFWVKIISAKE